MAAKIQAANEIRIAPSRGTAENFPDMNPATRLHAILVKVKEFEKNSPTLDAWRAILGFDEDTPPITIIVSVGKALSLPNMISSELRRVSDLDHDLFLGWIPELGAAFASMHYGSSFRDFRSKIPDSLLLNIRHCAHEIDRHWPEKEISPEDLAALRIEAEELLSAILDSDLDPRFSRYLLELMYRVCEALNDYDIFGAPPLERAVEQCIGSVLTQSEIAKPANDSELGKKVWNFVAKAGVLLKLADDTLKLCDRVTEMLPKSGG